MKLNLKSLAVCAAMLSFGFAENTDRIYANLTQICNAIDKDKKQIDNIYTVFTGVTDDPAKSLMTGQNNILYFDVKEERIPFPAEFFQLGVRKNLNNNDDIYDFEYNSGRLLVSCAYTYNIDDHYPCILCDVSTTDKFDTNSMEPIINIRYSNGNETDKKGQRLVSFRYTPYGENSADIQLRTLSKYDMSLDDYQRKLGIHGLSIQTLAAIGKYLMERAPELFDNLQKKEFTKDDTDHFINVIKKYCNEIKFTKS